jgi:hypothetical protein
MRVGPGTHTKNAFGQVLEIPPPIYDGLQWHRLSLLNSPETARTLEEFKRHSSSPPDPPVAPTLPDPGC